MKLLIALLVLTGSSLSLASCGWEETLCSPGEVFLTYEKPPGGGDCEKRKAGDPECPEGEILRRIVDTGREDCITDLVGHERDGLENPRRGDKKADR